MINYAQSAQLAGDGAARLGAVGSRGGGRTRGGERLEHDSGAQPAEVRTAVVGPAHAL
jgi:hypothetical protein